MEFLRAKQPDIQCMSPSNIWFYCVNTAFAHSVFSFVEGTNPNEVYESPRTIERSKDASMHMIRTVPDG
jgi:hypothetical protein